MKSLQQEPWGPPEYLMDLFVRQRLEVIGGPGSRGREREADQTRHSDRVDVQHPAQPR